MENLPDFEPKQETDSKGAYAAQTELPYN